MALQPIDRASDLLSAQVQGGRIPGVPRRNAIDYRIAKCFVTSASSVDVSFEVGQRFPKQRQGKNGVIGTQFLSGDCINGADQVIHDCIAILDLELEVAEAIFRKDRSYPSSKNICRLCQGQNRVISTTRIHSVRFSREFQRCCGLPLTKEVSKKDSGDGSNGLRPSGIESRPGDEIDYPPNDNHRRYEEDKPDCREANNFPDSVFHCINENNFADRTMPRSRTKLFWSPYAN